MTIVGLLRDCTDALVGVPTMATGVGRVDVDELGQ
jgi:hypothetical protein